MGGEGWGGVGGFLVITVSHPTFCCVGVGLWLRWGWAVTIILKCIMQFHTGLTLLIKKNNVN